MTNKKNQKYLKRLQYVQKKKFIIGIDIGSKFHYVQVQSSDFISIPFRINNNFDGFTKLSNYIQNNLTTNPDEVIIGLEPTGPYREVLANYLDKHNYEWVFVNPLHTKRYESIMHNSPLKSDKNDPSLIIALVKNGHYLTHPYRKGKYRELFNLVRIRSQLVVNRVQLYNQLHSVLSSYFPELLQVFSSIRLKSLQRVLIKYPTPDSIEKAGYEKIFKEIFKNTNKEWSNKKTKQLLQVSKKSVGISDGIESYKWQVRNLIININSLSQQIQEIEIHISEELNTMREADLLRSIKGLSDYSIGVILGYLGDITRYSSVYDIIKYAGLNLYEKSSGKRQGQKHISKRGSGILRQALYMAALNLIHTYPHIKEMYKRYVKNKRSKVKSIIPIMCYILKVVYAMIKNDRGYEIDYREKKVA